MQKWLVSQYWLLHQPHLTRVGMAVLGRLLHRQNPETGRCDPSVVGLMEETGYSERSIRGAFKELEERGAIKRYRVSKRARNQFLIYSVEELGNNRRSMELKMRAGQRTAMKPVAEIPAMRCRQTLQRAAPKKRKENIKKNDETGKCGEGGIIGIAGEPLNSGKQVTLADFERRVAKVFEREGLGYEKLINLSTGEVEHTYKQVIADELTFSQAVGRLLKASKAQIDGS
ncbi:hypothetical protein [Roseobacter sp. EG26]|uniref:hypothetical protein n=1 Tax=Roseobacter sp. EG26 TaxID=3412477 RepID=UPI003CE47DF7